MGYNTAVVFPYTAKNKIKSTSNIGEQISDSARERDFRGGGFTGIFNADNFVTTALEHADAYSFVMTHGNTVLNLGSYYYTKPEDLKKRLRLHFCAETEKNAGYDHNSNLVINFLMDGIDLVRKTEDIGLKIWDKFDNMSTNTIRNKRFIDVGIAGFCNPITIVDAPCLDAVTVSYVGGNCGGRLGVIETDNPEKYIQAFYDIEMFKRYKNMYDPFKKLNEAFRDAKDLMALRKYDARVMAKKSGAK